MLGKLLEPIILILSASSLVDPSTAFSNLQLMQDLETSYLSWKKIEKENDDSIQKGDYRHHFGKI